MGSDRAITVGNREAAAAGGTQVNVISVVIGSQSAIQLAIQTAFFFTWTRDPPRTSNWVKQSSQRFCCLRGLRPQAFDLARDVVDRAGAQSREHVANLRGHRPEIGFNHLRFSGKSSA